MNLVGRKFNNPRLNIDINVYEIDGENWFMGKEATSLLGYSENSRPLRKWGERGAIVWEENKKKIYVRSIEIIGKCWDSTSIQKVNNNIIMVNELGLSQLIYGTEKLTQSQKKEWCDVLGIKNTFVSRKEIEFLYILKEALKELELEVVDQYRVNNYRVDFYIPKKNLAIEYDEQHHFVEDNKIKDLERQKYIESKLGCKFVRCDYRDSDIKNLMKVLREVM